MWYLILPGPHGLCEGHPEPGEQLLHHLHGGGHQVLVADQPVHRVRQLHPRGQVVLHCAAVGRHIAGLALEAAAELEAGLDLRGGVPHQVHQPQAGPGVQPGQNTAQVQSDRLHNCYAGPSTPQRVLTMGESVKDRQKYFYFESKSK